MIIKISELQDLDNHEERIYKKGNIAKDYLIPIGTFVELENGEILWVFHHGKNYDGTPLYYLSPL